MARIACRHLTKQYGNVTAVDRLDLEIRDTEFMVLLGPSGCGKTTTLNIIAGLEEITEGDIYFDDALMNYVPPHKREVAMVFQSYALYPQKTVFENIAFGLRLRKVSDAGCGAWSRPLPNGFRSRICSRAGRPNSLAASAS